jgi:predicted transcriptional regulator
METENYVIKKDYTINELISYLKPEKYSFFFIINDNGKIIKTLSEEQLINSYFKYGPDLSIYKVL